MSTTPNRPSARRQVSASARYRSSKMWRGSVACGNSTVPSGNIGSGFAITPTYRLASAPRARSVRAGPEPRSRGRRLLGAFAGKEARQHVELARRLGEVSEPAEQSREVAALTQRDARYPQAQAGHPYDGTRITLHQRVLEVGQHPFDDAAWAHRHQVLRTELRAGVRLREELGAAGEIEPGAAVEGIEPLSRATADQEVPGHTDSVHLESAPPTDLQHQDAQCDRDTEATIEHLVEQRVARIAVVGSVPREPFGDEQERCQLAARHAGACVRERVELGETRVDV